jgi:hypothetical protein
VVPRPPWLVVGAACVVGPAACITQECQNA